MFGTPALPVVVAPHDSGVTQQDLNDALVSLIETRTIDIMSEIVRGMMGASDALIHALSVRDLSQVTMARILREIDTHIDQITRDRLALQYRMAALESQRTTSAARAEDPDQIRSAS